MYPVSPMYVHPNLKSYEVKELTNYYSKESIESEILYLEEFEGWKLLEKPHTYDGRRWFAKMRRERR